MIYIVVADRRQRRLPQSTPIIHIVVVQYAMPSACGAHYPNMTKSIIRRCTVPIPGSVSIKPRSIQNQKISPAVSRYGRCGCACQRRENRPAVPAQSIIPHPPPQVKEKRATQSRPLSSFPILSLILHYHISLLHLRQSFHEGQVVVRFHYDLWNFPLFRFRLFHQQ